MMKSWRSRHTYHVSEASHPEAVKRLVSGTVIPHTFSQTYSLALKGARARQQRDRGIDEEQDACTKAANASETPTVAVNFIAN